MDSIIFWAENYRHTPALAHCQVSSILAGVPSSCSSLSFCNVAILVVGTHRTQGHPELLSHLSHKKDVHEEFFTAGAATATAISRLWGHRAGGILAPTPGSLRAGPPARRAHAVPNIWVYVGACACLCTHKSVFLCMWAGGMGIPSGFNPFTGSPKPRSEFRGRVTVWPKPLLPEQLQ